MSNGIVKMGQKVIQQEVQKNKSALRKKNQAREEPNPCSPQVMVKKFEAAQTSREGKKPSLEQAAEREVEKEEHSPHQLN
jgi:hypothetical protein